MLEIYLTRVRSVGTGCNFSTIVFIGLKNLGNCFLNILSLISFVLLWQRYFPIRYNKRYHLEMFLKGILIFLRQFVFITCVTIEVVFFKKKKQLGQSNSQALHLFTRSRKRKFSQQDAFQLLQDIRTSGSSVLIYLSQDCLGKYVVKPGAFYV